MNDDDADDMLTQIEQGAYQRALDNEADEQANQEYLESLNSERVAETMSSNALGFASQVFHRGK